MTNQEAFDKMMEHLRNLKERSMDEQNSAVCVYNGTKCAVGALMTDEEQEKFGDYAGGVLSLKYHMTDCSHTSTLHTLDLNFLEEMQYLHDNFNNWSCDGFCAEGEAEDIANKYKLTYTKP